MSHYASTIIAKKQTKKEKNKLKVKDCRRHTRLLIYITKKKFKWVHLHSTVKCNEVFQLHIHTYTYIHMHTYIHTFIHLNLNGHITHSLSITQSAKDDCISMRACVCVCISLRIQQFLSCFICIHSMSSCFCKHTIKANEYNKKKKQL